MRYRSIFASAIAALAFATSAFAQVPATNYVGPDNRYHASAGVTLIDPATGDAYKASGGAGGGAGTEYTEDSIAPANPVAPMQNCRRRDTLSAAEVSADLDVITMNCSAKGQLHTLSEISNTSLAVTGPLTDVQLRATAVPISGTVTATGPLTDTQLRATAVPVSGPLTDTQLRASAVPHNQTQVNGVAVATGNGVVGTGVQRVAIASDNSNVPVAIQGTLPAFASTPTFNCGTGCSAGAGTAQGATITGATGGLNMGSVTTAAPSYTTSTINSLSLTTAGALRVDNSAVTQPISGSLTNISGTISLPTGAATAANQATEITSLGTIATNSGTQATAANQTSVIGTKAAGTAAASALLTGGVYNSTPPTLTTGQQVALQLDSAGSLKVSGAGGGTQYAEDAAHADGNLGTMALGVRKNTAASTSGADGDYQPMIFDTNGMLWVNVGTNAVQGTTSDTSSTNSMFGALLALKAAAQDTTTVLPYKIDQTTPGTTNGVRTDSSGATGSAAPARAEYTGVNSGGNLVGMIQADTSAKVSISTNTTTQIVALSSGKKIYVTNFNLHSAGTTTTKFVYGTGTNCGTGTTDVTDLYDFTASDGIVSGGGLGPVLVIPASQALCITNTAAVHVGGSIAYTQF